MRPELAALVDWLHESGRMEDLLALARFVGENSVRLLVATGVLTHEEINDWFDEAALSPWCTQVMLPRPPPGRFVT
jgi:hypothetical protein